jgi:PKHD-type hydroxylase
MENKTYNWFIHNAQEEEHWGYRPTFTKEQCEEVIKVGTSLNLSDGIVGDKALGSVNHDIRKSRVSWIPSNNPDIQWIFRHCTDLVNEMNERFFKYDLLYIENLQFTEYNGSEENSSYYGRHIDTAFKNNGSRKLSFSILLSEENSYVGGDLLLHYLKEPAVAPRQQGLAIVFPSTMLHEVTPVTSGTRYSLVGWVVGPRFK